MVCVECNKTWTTPEDKQASVIKQLASLLRKNPLLPPLPEFCEDGLDCGPDSSLKYPLAHCAFTNCTWCSDVLPCPKRPLAQKGCRIVQDGVWKNFEPSTVDAENCLPLCCGESSCLRFHVVHHHSQHFLNLDADREMLKNPYDDVYLEAIASIERRKMPDVGRCSFCRLPDSFCFPRHVYSTSGE